MQQVELDLFPVPVTVMTLGEQSRAMNQKIIVDLEDDKFHNYEAPLRSSVNVWQSNFTLENRYDTFQYLQDYFFELSKPTLHRAGFQGNLNDYMICEDFWGNINESPWGFHTPHYHGHGKTVFSGVYFPSSGVLDGKNLSDDQNLDELVELTATSTPPAGAIVFMDPSINIKRQVFPLGDKLKRYPYYGLELCIVPKEGTLVLFPHYVTHYVTPTEKFNFKRYSIPFSINLKKHVFYNE